MCRLGASLFVDTTMMPTSLVTTPKEVMLSLAMEATCLLTSGSVSGVGKGVRHTLGNHLFSAKGFWEAFPSANHVSWALVLPLFHVGGLAILFRTFLAHGTVVLSKEPLGQLLQQRVTHISLVPTHLARLIHGVTKEWHPSRELSCVLMGGDRVSSILRSEGQALGLPLLISYGMTETSSLICATTSIVEGEVGHPLPYRKIKTDAAGKIFVQGKTVCLGYWEMTAPTEVWWPTQDCGYLDDTGGLTVTGRADRIFISGGENIDPLEIEQVLYLLPWVYEARVQAVPCFEFGHKGVAHIVTAPNQGSEEALLAHLSLYLPRFKLPRQFYIQALDLICPLGAQLMLSSHGSL
jgi:O-succinylbenzoic acid--CoA ligase